MKKTQSRILLVGVIICYGFFYIATSYEKDCISCNQLNEVYLKLAAGRPYVLGVNSCAVNRASLDTVCISVTDTTGINWPGLADTACIISKQQSLSTKVFYVLKSGTSPQDTLAKVLCP